MTMYDEVAAYADRTGTPPPLEFDELFPAPEDDGDFDYVPIEWYDTEYEFKAGLLRDYRPTDRLRELVKSRMIEEGNVKEPHDPDLQRIFIMKTAKCGWVALVSCTRLIERHGQINDVGSCLVVTQLVSAPKEALPERRCKIGKTFVSAHGYSGYIRSSRIYQLSDLVAEDLSGTAREKEGIRLADHRYVFQKCLKLRDEVLAAVPNIAFLELTYWGGLFARSKHSYERLKFMCKVDNDMLGGPEVNSVVERRKTLERIEAAKAVEALGPAKISCRGHTLTATPGMQYILTNGVRVSRDGKSVRLHGNVPASVYAQYKKALVSMGGRWVSSKQSIVFTKDAFDLIDELTTLGTCTLDKPFGFFETPTVNSNDLAKWAGIENAPEEAVMLEPEAGGGNLVAAGLLYGIKSITAVEVWPDNVKKLSERFDGKDVWVMEADFMKLSITVMGRYDFILMNPPFGKGAEMSHVLHAWSFLVEGGTLAAIMPTSIQFGTTKAHEEFRAFIKDNNGVIEPLPSGTFKESGTMVNTVRVKISKD